MLRSRWISLGLSLCVTLWFAGCGDPVKKGGYTDVDKAPVEPPEAHAHAHEEHGPHGGHLVELGDHEYHGEVCYDKESKKITVYILGHELDKAVPITEKEVTLSLKIDGTPKEFKLAAAPLEGEAEGKASRFELAGDPEVSEHIKDEEDLQGRLNVSIEGKPYSGDIEHDHGHNHDHGHSHDHGKPGEKEADHKHDEPKGK